MKRKKVLAVCLVGAMAATLLAGCGRNSETAAEEAEEVAEETEVVAEEAEAAEEAAEEAGEAAEDAEAAEETTEEAAEDAEKAEIDAEEIEGIAALSAQDAEAAEEGAETADEAAEDADEIAVASARDAEDADEIAVASAKDAEGADEDAKTADEDAEDAAEDAEAADKDAVAADEDAEDATEDAEDAAEDAEDAAEDAKDAAETAGGDGDYADKAAYSGYYKPEITEDEEYTPGVTIEKDEESPTGYTVTFVYEDPDAMSVSLCSYDMYFYKPETGLEVRYTPYAWEDGMFNMPDDYKTSSIQYEEPMTRVGDDLWVSKVPLPGGDYQYRYCVDGEYVDDPTIEYLQNELTGTVLEGRNMYVPTDTEKQSVDRSAIMPRDGENGTLVYDQYEDGDAMRDIVVYLPYEYDEDREEPYKVIYAFSPTGRNELDWIDVGLSNIMDNLIAEDLAEPAVVVCICLNDIEDPILNQKENLRPYIEETYNVATDAEGSACCGLSNGASTVARIYVDDPTAYGYYGIWGSAQSAELELDGIEGLDEPVLLIGTALDDARHAEAHIFYENVAAINDKVTHFTEHTGHSCNFWADAYTYFVKNILWK